MDDLLQVYDESVTGISKDLWVLITDPELTDDETVFEFELDGLQYNAMRRLVFFENRFVFVIISAY
jgi:hypothetical protein